METIKINGMNVTVDLSNQFVIAQVPRVYKVAEKFITAVADIRDCISRKFNVSALEVELVAISKNNKVVIFSGDVSRMRNICKFFNVTFTGYFKFFDAEDPKWIIEKMKDLHKSSKELKSFYEVIIEPTSGSTIWNVLKDMKSLSELIGMPVCAKLNDRNLRITPTTDIDDTARCFFSDIDTDSVTHCKE